MQIRKLIVSEKKEKLKSVVVQKIFTKKVDILGHFQISIRVLIKSSYVY